MKINKNQEKIIDLAWEKLYNRLEQDNLLNESKLPNRSFFQSKIVKWSVAAAILCMCILSGIYIFHNKNVIDNELLVLHNEKNSPVLATVLEDGSAVYLSEDATIKYPEHFQTDKRIVSFEGDAFFEISKQPERPFFIYTELVKIEVLGTSFSVKTGDNSTFLLSVRSGNVKVTLNENNQSISVKAGEATLFEKGSLHIIDADLQQYNNYFKKILFKDEHLIDVIKIINQNSQSTQIELSNELKERRITLTFSRETPEIMAELICVALNLNHYQRQNIIYITE